MGDHKLMINLDGGLTPIHAIKLAIVYAIARVLELGYGYINSTSHVLR